MGTGADILPGQNAEPRPVSPTYVFATLPGETKPEFLLMIAEMFTPLSKENLIGVMLARCDGDKLGEMVVLQLSKQELTLGPMQINARINQDQNISKDLTLWNQQGSQVLQGQTLVLPVGDTFLYVLADLSAGDAGAHARSSRSWCLRSATDSFTPTRMSRRRWRSLSGGGGSADRGGKLARVRQPPPGAPPARRPPLFLRDRQNADPRIESIRESIRQHLQRYRDLTSQGKWAEAGRELEAIQNEVQK